MLLRHDFELACLAGSWRVSQSPRALLPRDPKWHLVPSNLDPLDPNITPRGSKNAALNIWSREARHLPKISDLPRDGPKHSIRTPRRLTEAHRRRPDSARIGPDKPTDTAENMSAL